MITFEVEAKFASIKGKWWISDVTDMDGNYPSARFVRDEAQKL